MMSGNSKVIFSVYQEVKDLSVTSYKKQQLHLYKDRLANRQKEYAKFCGADYFVYETDEFLIDDYTSIQFMKIKQFEELAKDYDEILYLDLDVIPYIFKNFFKEHDLSKLCCLQQDGKVWGLDRYYKSWQRYKYLDDLDSQSWWVKACAKNAMLLLDNHRNFNDMIINTGVLGGNSHVIKQLKFTENLNDMIELLYRAKQDNVYQKKISDNMIPNNEVFLTYLVEKNKIPVNYIEKKWNHIIDEMGDGSTDFPILWNSPTSNLHMKDSYFLHLINKRFEKCQISW